MNDDRKSVVMFEVREIRQTSSCDWVVCYRAAFEAQDNDLSVIVESFVGDPDPQLIPIAVSAIERGAKQVVDCGNLKIWNLMIHPVDFLQVKYETVTAEALRAALVSEDSNLT